MAKHFRRYSMEPIPTERKGQILTRARFGCLSEVYSLNITRGCEFECVYCYARGYPEAPGTGKILLYANLPEKLARELDNPRRRKNITKVVFNTASDSFQTHPDILKVSYHSMEVLLKRGIFISFLTKGWIPHGFIQLFAKHRDLVSANIGIVSLSERYQKLFEPGAATPSARLDNIDRLQAAGIEPQVRIDPIIPFYTDDESSVRELFKGLAQRSINKVTLSYIHLRPTILRQLQKELPATHFKVLEACFKTQEWVCVGSSTRSKLIPVDLRKSGYKRFINLGKEYGIACLICSCKNPDMPAHRCFSGAPHRAERGSSGPIQLSLFQC